MRKRGGSFLLIVLIVSVLLPTGLSGVANALDFVVNSTLDGSDADLNNPACATSGGVCTLRAALEQANHTMVSDTINFSIGVSGGQQTIIPTSALPEIDTQMTIDGSTQPGFSDSPLIEITGDSAGDVEGLVVDAGASEINSLIVNGYDGIGGGGRSGILVRSSGNSILGNWVGLDHDGVTKKANHWGIFVTGADNLIGGTGAEDGNVVSGNNGVGIVLHGAGATNNRLRGNYIGTDYTGTQPAGNQYGVDNFLASGNFIGTAEEGGGNLISGNSHPLATTYNIGSTGGDDLSILNNFIGTDVTGTNSIGAGANDDGILINDDGINPATDTVIGRPGAGNVIGGNQRGIVLMGATGVKVRSNRVGVDAEFDPLKNLSQGVEILESPNFGVLTESNTIGGPKLSQTNVIANNDGDGISIDDATSTGNSILRNSIFGNDGLGIDLAADGPTPNDGSDADSGPNELQNFPSLKYVAPFDGKTVVKGLLRSTPSTDFTIQVYVSPTMDPTGSGEGRFYMATKNVQTSATGRAPFKITLNDALIPGIFVTGTATDTDGNTSEFSKAERVCTKLGNGKANVIRGTGGNDVLCGGGGGDTLIGRGGADVLLGGPGADELKGGGGKDRLEGGPGDDDLSGGPARDVCSGGPGKDDLVSCERKT